MSGRSDEGTAASDGATPSTAPERGLVPSGGSAVSAEVWERLACAYATPIAVGVVRLMAGPPPDGQAAWSPKLLALMLEVPLGKVAYHVRELRSRGVVVQVGMVRGAARRGAVEHFYALAAP